MLTVFLKTTKQLTNCFSASMVIHVVSLQSKVDVCGAAKAEIGPVGEHVGP